MKFKFLSRCLVLTGCLGGALSATAAELEIKIQNLTKGITYTGFIVAAHDHDYWFFRSGTMASAGLKAMAEGGDITGLNADAVAANATVVQNPNNGNLPPASSTPSFTLNTGDNNYLSLVAMLLPTNDGFTGLDSWHIPSTPGTYTIDLNAYDAGTEINNELINGGGTPGVLGIPIDPSGNNGLNGTGIADPSPNSYIHIHPGVIGDYDLNAGPSDLDARVHRWLNPVARVTVTVK